MSVVLPGAVVKQIRAAGAGVVDQVVDVEATLLYLLEQRRRRGWIRQVGLNDVDADAVSFCMFSRQGPQPVFSTGDKYQVVAGGGQLPRKFAAEAPVIRVRFCIMRDPVALFSLY
mgnify:CR=1 FL=1